MGPSQCHPVISPDSIASFCLVPGACVWALTPFRDEHIHCGHSDLSHKPLPVSMQFSLFLPPFNIVLSLLLLHGMAVPPDSSAYSWIANIPASSKLALTGTESCPTAFPMEHVSGLYGRHVCSVFPSPVCVGRAGDARACSRMCLFFPLKGQSHCLI